MSIVVRCALVYADGFRYAVCGGLDTPREVASIDELMGLPVVDDYDTRLAALRAYVWGTPALPTTLPTYAADVVEARFASVGADKIDLLTFATPFATTQYAWRLRHTIAPAVAVCLWNPGHQSNFVASSLEVMADLYAGGVDVVSMAMPFEGDNTDGFYGGVLNDHDDLQAVEADRVILGYSALRLFCDPVVQTLNQLASAYAKVAMAGLSGGGWTACVAAALDRRLGYSFQINGSVPHFRRDSNVGDWEQSSPGAFYSIAPYEHLYIMGAYRGRTAIQILSEYDSTFPNGRVMLDAYREAIKTRLCAVDPSATWEGIIDPTTIGTHIASKAACATVLEYL